MFSIRRTGQFKKDYKRIKKRNYNLSLLVELLNLLVTGNKLPKKFLEHPLKGRQTGNLECHIKSDWLLIYKRDMINKEIILIRTGTHADLFKM